MQPHYQFVWYRSLTQSGFVTHSLALKDRTSIPSNKLDLERSNVPYHIIMSSKDFFIFCIESSSSKHIISIAFSSCGELHGCDDADRLSRSSSSILMILRALVLFHLSNLGSDRDSVSNKEYCLLTFVTKQEFHSVSAFLRLHDAHDSDHHHISQSAIVIWKNEVSFPAIK